MLRKRHASNVQLEPHDEQDPLIGDKAPLSSKRCTLAAFARSCRRSRVGRCGLPVGVRSGSRRPREMQSDGLCSDGMNTTCRVSPAAKQIALTCLRILFNGTEPDLPLPSAPTATLESTKTTIR
jgi:hypothetical protein